MMSLKDPRLIDELWRVWLDGTDPTYKGEKHIRDTYQFIHTGWYYSQKFERWLYDHCGVTISGEPGKKKLTVVNEEKALALLLKYA